MTIRSDIPDLKYFVDLSSSSSTTRIYTVPLCQSDDNPHYFFPLDSFTAKEVFTESLVNDSLVLNIKRTEVDNSMKPALSSVKILASCTIKISSLPSVSREITTPLLLSGVVVGNVRLVAVQSIMDNSDSEDGGSLDNEPLGGRNGSLESHDTNMDITRASSDISHDRIKNLPEAGGGDSNLKNRSWKAKAISIFKGKRNSTMPSSPLIGKTTKGAMENHQEVGYHDKNFDSANAKTSRLDTTVQRNDDGFLKLDLPHPLAIQCDEEDFQSQKIRLSDEDSLKRSKSNSNSIDIDSLLPSLKKDSIFEPSSVDINDLLGDFAKDMNTKSRTLSSDSVQICESSMNTEGNMPKEPTVSDENEIFAIEKDPIKKLGSLLKPVKRTSVSATLSSEMKVDDLEHSNLEENESVVSVIDNATPTISVTDGQSQQLRSNNNRVEVSNSVDTKMNDEGSGTFPIETLIEEAEEYGKDQVLLSGVEIKRLGNESHHVEMVHDIITGGEVIGMFSDTKCPDCGFVFLDEEVLSQWGIGSKSLQSFSKTNSIHQNMRVENLRLAHIIKCSQCSASISPILTVKSYRTESGTLSVKWKKEILHISPFCLRLLYEHLVNLHGFKVVDSDFLILENETVFWCLRWYSMKLGCPIGFNASLSKESGLLVHGRKEITVTRRILTMLGDNSVDKGHAISAVTTRSLLALHLPDLSEENMDLLCDVGENDLDGTTHGLRRAIMKIYPHIDRILPRKNKVNMYIAKARNLYECLLILCHLTTCGENLLRSPDNETVLNLEKV